MTGVQTCALPICRSRTRGWPCASWCGHRERRRLSNDVELCGSGDRRFWARASGDAGEDGAVQGRARQSAGLKLTREVLRLPGSRSRKSFRVASLLSPRILIVPRHAQDVPSPTGLLTPRWVLPVLLGRLRFSCDPTSSNIFFRPNRPKELLGVD